MNEYIARINLAAVLKVSANGEAEAYQKVLSQLPTSMRKNMTIEVRIQETSKKGQ